MSIPTLMVPRVAVRRDSLASSGRTRKQGGMHNILLMNLSREAVIPGEFSKYRLRPYHP